MKFDIPDSYWEKQKRQYPRQNKHGIHYFKTVIGDKHVDCLLYYDEKQKLCGIFNHFPFDIPPYEVAGNINIIVNPTMRRKGIGTALLKEAMSRWDIDLKRQLWSMKGKKFFKKYQKIELNKKISAI
jgi:GNAT superfamily N-acetyltransferase